MFIQIFNFSKCHVQQGITHHCSSTVLLMTFPPMIFSRHRYTTAGVTIRTFVFPSTLMHHSFGLQSQNKYYYAYTFYYNWMKMSGQLHSIVSGDKLSLTSLSLSFNFAISKYAANFFFFLSLRRDWFDVSGFITYLQMLLLLVTSTLHVSWWHKKPELVFLGKIMQFSMYKILCLTQYMEQNHSWEATSHSHAPEIEKSSQSTKSSSKGSLLSFHPYLDLPHVLLPSEFIAKYLFFQVISPTSYPYHSMI